MKLSIIIPAYNAETYIESCLTSICTQDLKIEDYEILVVNDGSKDRTEQKVLAMAKDYPNIHLKFQENKGNGAARNTGVSHAKGEYILFLDADDYLAINALGTLVGLVVQHNLDMLGFSSKNVTDSSETDSTDDIGALKMDDVVSGIDFIGKYNYKAEVWWYLVKRSFYIESGVHFYDRKFVQDSYLTPTLFSKAKRAAYLDFDVHRYRQSQNSITRAKSVDHLNKHFNDLSYSIKKLFELRHNLIDQGVSNKLALQRLHLKQQRYVFIVIVRFMKSKIKASELEKMLSDFKTLEAYPMDKFMSLPDYRTPVYQALTFIFNRKYLLYPTLSVYRFLFR
tara:strand:+ start:6125 stop:7138 length:1014 start_codon:yes stop_codon:yes gene_type:complete